MSGQAQKRKGASKNKASSSSSEPMVMVPLSFMAAQERAGRKFQPGPGNSTFFINSRHSEASASSRRKPWKSEEDEELVDDNDDEDDEEEEEFRPAKKTRRSLPAKLSLPKKEPMSAAAQVAWKKVKALPDKFMGRPIVCVVPDKDCMSCGVYLGEIMLTPCGHAKFCTKCVNKIHEKAFRNKQLVRCPVDECYASIEGWLRLHNCMS